MLNNSLCSELWLKISIVQVTSFGNERLIMVPATQSKWFQNAQVNTCEEHVICYTIYSKKTHTHREFERTVPRARNAILTGD